MLSSNIFCHFIRFLTMFFSFPAHFLNICKDCPACNIPGVANTTWWNGYQSFWLLLHNIMYLFDSLHNNPSILFECCNNRNGYKLNVFSKRINSWESRNKYQIFRVSKNSDLFADLFCDRCNILLVENLFKYYTVIPKKVQY